MDTKKINLLIYDTKQNFEKSKQLFGEEGGSFKRLICIETLLELDKYFSENQLLDDDFVFLVVHVFALDNINGIKKFVVSGIREKYPKLSYMFISEGGSESTINHLMVDSKLQVSPVFKYHEVFSSLRDDTAVAYTKKEIVNFATSLNLTSSSEVHVASTYPQIDYAIITALYKDEFEELKKVFDFPEEKQIKTDKKIFYRGYLKSNPSVEVVAAIPNSTGMLDASIVATLLLEFFKPKYLLMSGVCGGAKNLDFGDVVIAKQVFTFQKGKLSDIKKKGENGKFEKIDLFDINKVPVDYNCLFDGDGKQITISIEKFEIEHDSIIAIDSLFEDSLNPKMDEINNNINEIVKSDTFFSSKKSIKIVVEPMACSTMVINKDGYFDDTIRSIHRKTAAVEMESYGVAKACQFANNGKTIPIIFKSVMDNTVNKEDIVGGIDYKKFAAFTSAQFMKCLFELKVI